MPQPPDKKRSKRAQKRIDSGDTTEPSQTISNLRPLSMSEPMHKWPVHECIVPERWSQPGEQIQLVVTRRSAAGELAAAIFGIDLGCLGVRNAYTLRFTNDTEYQAWLRTLPIRDSIERVSIDLAAKIVRTAVDYASSLGFRPHRDFPQASAFLSDAQTERAEEDVPTGMNGQPYVATSPTDDLRTIVRQLDRKVGRGNYQIRASTENPSP